jgi:pyruvate formate-lyase activating enzyme-like uncharacterized protein
MTAVESALKKFEKERPFTKKEQEQIKEAVKILEDQTESFSFLKWNQLEYSDKVTAEAFRLWEMHENMKWCEKYWTM